jgi:hypothetical protein
MLAECVGASTIGMGGGIIDREDWTEGTDDE